MRFLPLLAALLMLLPAAAAAAPAQTLAIVLHDQRVETERLQHYRATRPISVRVRGEAAKFERMTVTASGPGGAALSVPLARTADGFEGDVNLATPGTWTLALRTELGAFSTNLTSVALDVVPAMAVSVWAMFFFVLAALASAGGVTLFVSPAARRRVAAIRIRS